MAKYYRLTYRENNVPTILGQFSSQEELDRLILEECKIIHEESLLSFDDQDYLIKGLKAWARSQWNPNADRTFVYRYPEVLLTEARRPIYTTQDSTVGRWTITEY